MALPTGYETWNKRRRQRHWANKRNAKKVLLDPSVPLSGGALEQAAKHLVDLEIGPQLSAIDRQISNVRTQGGAVADRANRYYADLRGHEETDRKRVDQINEELQTRMSAIGQDAQGQIQGTANEIQARLRQDEVNRGPGLTADTAARVAAEQQALGGRSALLAQTAQGEGAVLGADIQRTGEARIGATRARGGEVQEQLANQLANQISEAQADRRDIEGTRGEKLTSNILKLRDSAVEQALTAAGYQIKQEDIQARLRMNTEDNYTKRLIAKMNRLEKQRDRALRAKDNRAARRLRAEANDIRRQLGQETLRQGERRLGIQQQNADANTQRANQRGRGGGSNFTPSQVRANREKWDKTMAAAGDVPGIGGKNLSLILRGQGIPPLMAQTYAKLKAGKKLSQKERHAFWERYGFIPKR